MKKLFLTAAAVLAFSAGNAQEGKFEAKINPLGALFGRPELSGEYIVSENFGVELSLSTAFGTTGSAVTVNGVSSEKPTQSGFGVKALAKYYFNPKEGADGWYGAIYLRQESLDLKYSNATNLNYKSSIFAGGVEFGKKWAWSSGFLIEAGLGIGRPFSEKREFTNSNSPYTTSIELGVDVTGKFAVGYRF